MTVATVGCKECDGYGYVVTRSDPYAAEPCGTCKRVFVDTETKGYWQREATIKELQEKHERVIKVVEWMQEEFEREWTYEMGTGEVVEEIIQKLLTALGSGKNGT